MVNRACVYELFQFPPATGEEAWTDYYCSAIDGAAVNSVTIVSMNCFSFHQRLGRKPGQTTTALPLMVQL